MDLNDIIYSEGTMLAGGDALIAVDVQNDFMPGGALPVAGGDEIVDGVNSLMQLFMEKGLTVVLTQDWHTPDHRSFASSHKNKKPYDLFEEPGIGPVLWPDHCVQGESGADFHKKLNIRPAQAVIRKGFHRTMDSYSGFLENDRKTETGLHGYLKNKSVKRIFVCGLALDYCVFFTAFDGAVKGYGVYVVPDLTRAVGSPENSVSNALNGLKAKGVSFIRPGDIKG